MPFVAAPRTRPHGFIRLACCAALLALLAAAGALGQTTSVTDGSTPSALTPGAPAGSYPLSGFESVNLFNGNLNFALPLVRTGGRGSVGASVTLKIEQHWRIKEIKPIPNCELSGTCEASRFPDANGWLGVPDYNPGVLKARAPGVKCGDLALTRLTFTAGDGTEYELRDQLTGGQPKGFSCNPSQGHLRGAVFVTADGAAATFISDAVIYDWTGQAPTTISPSGHLKLRDGSTYRVDEGKVMWVRDRNGNRVSYTYEGPKVKTITDTLGRVVTINYNVSDVAPYGVCEQIVYKGFGGADRVVRVSRARLDAVLRTTRPADPTAPRTLSQLFPEIGGASAYTAYNPYGRVAAVWLPDDGVNRRAYRFFYNVYGELARVELPTGGAVEYDFDNYSNPYDGIFRGVTERRVYADGTSLEGRTTYAPGTVDVYDAAGTLLARSRHSFYGSPQASLAQFPTDYAGWREGREYKTEHFGVTNGVASAAPLRRVEREWRQRAPVGWWAGTAEREPANDPRVVETMTTVEPGGADLVTKQSSVNPQTGAVGFDQFNNPTDLWEYDFGAGAAPARAVRHTHTDYLTTNNGVDYTSAAGAHLRGLASARQVYAVNPSTGAETLVARGETRYDEAAYPPLACGTAESPVACGSAPQWDDPGTAPRGNATTSRRWLDTTNTWPETHAQYDRLGNVRYTWDAKGALSQVSYLDSFCNGDGCGGTYAPNTFAFPTAARSPKPDPSGTYGSAAGLTSSTVYDFHTGLVYSAKDANNQTTRLEYADPLDRPTAEVRPDGGRTDVYYSQPNEPASVRTLADLDGARRLKSEQHLDKLGRATRSFTWEGQDAGNPWLTADTHYDALGRAWKTSSPYRSAGPGGAADVNRAGTVTTFDALGRVAQVKTTADGAAVKTDYAGQRLLVTDQAGKQRISKTDALGRLTEVWEVAPNDPAKYPGVESIPTTVTAGLPTASAYGYRTEYFYDPVGNLRRVKQGTQERFFAYDSLGRLVRAKNLEQGAFAADGDFPALTDATSGENNGQWSMGYVYDANGNLVKRKDARGVITAYAYDALNRSTLTSYANDPSGTPNAVRKYDFGAGGRGRPYLVAQGGSTTSATYLDQYDAAGRTIVRRQKFETNGVWSADYTVGLEYNLAGGVTKLTYPSGRRVEYQYDAAGRLGDNGSLPAFKGNLGDWAERTYASQVLYDELGGVSQERFGTDTPVYNKRFYNSRGQLADIRVSTHPADAPGKGTDWNRGAILNHYSQAVWGGSDQHNNGNLRTQQVWVPHDDLIGGWSLFEQTYDYDALNRLRVAGEGSQWRQQFDYDRWGNRTVNAAGTWLGQPSTPPSELVNEKQFSADAATNRLGVPAGQTGRMDYDAAGNLINDSYSPQSYGSLTNTQTRFYDAEGRMTSAQTSATQTASYVYDADGRRVRRMAGTAGEVWHVYGAGGELLAEYAPGAALNQPSKEYGYRGGELLVTVSGASGASGVSTEGVAWTNVVGATASGSTLTKTAAEAWGNAGASSAQSITSGDGYVEFTASQAFVERVCGLSNGDTDRGHADVDFGILLSDGGYVYAWESGVQKASAGAYAVGDRLRVAVEGGAVRYYKNGALFHTSAAAPTYPLLADAALYTAGSTLSGVVISGGLASAAAASWADAAGVTASGGGLTKTAATGWGNAGASSAQAAASGGVYVEFTATADRTDRACGLGGGAAARDLPDIDFGILLSDGGYVYAVEGGTVRASAGTYATGDRLRVAVEGGAVRYYRNGAPFYTSGATAAYPLRAEAALYEQGAGLGEVRLWSAPGGAGVADVRWLVADQLGTPRMVVDRTGSLAGVTRHDYLPFGEELSAGTGGRMSTQGYSAVDSIRHKYTGTEKDNETGLYYFGARYYANAQGRFLSVDPIKLASDRLLDPQQLNLYGYCRDNPLKYVDPDGEKIVLANATARARARVNIDKTLRNRAERGNIIISGSQVRFVPRNQVTNPSAAYTRLVGVISATEVHRYYGVAPGQTAQATAPTAVDATTGLLLPQRLTFTHNNLLTSGGASLTLPNGDMDHFVPVSGNMTVEGTTRGSVIPFPEYRSWFHEILGHEPLQLNPSPAALDANNKKALQVENQIAGELGLPLRSGNDHDPNTYDIHDSQDGSVTTERLPLTTTITPQPLIPVPRPNP